VTEHITMRCGVIIEQTPFVNTSSVSSTNLWPNEIRLVDRLEPIITPQP
jgi:hypothetical protein